MTKRNFTQSDRIFCYWNAFYKSTTSVCGVSVNPVSSELHWKSNFICSILLCWLQQNNPYYYSLKKKNLFCFYTQFTQLQIGSTAITRPCLHNNEQEATKTWMGLSAYQTAHRWLNASSISRTVTNNKNFSNNLNV
jgi:hypothetical protein